MSVFFIFFIPSLLKEPMILLCMGSTLTDVTHSLERGVVKLLGRLWNMINKYVALGCLITVLHIFTLYKSVLAYFYHSQSVCKINYKISIINKNQLWFLPKIIVKSHFDSSQSLSQICFKMNSTNKNQLQFLPKITLTCAYFTKYNLRVWLKIYSVDKL